MFHVSLFLVGCRLVGFPDWREVQSASKHSDHAGCRLPQPPLLSEAVSQSLISDPGQLLRQDDRGSGGKETEDQRLWPLQSTDKYGGG